MTTRTRNEDFAVPYTGEYWYNTTKLSTLTASEWLSQVSTTDTVGEWENDNPLSINRYSSEWPRLTGKSNVIPGKGYEYKSYPITWRNYSLTPLEVFVTLSEAELQAYAAKVVGDSNPSVPSVSVPVALGELKDVPDMVRGFWKDILKSKDTLRKLAAGNLSWRFGLKPMISDARKLLKFSEEVAKLLATLRRLKRVGVIHRRVLLRWDLQERTISSNSLLNSTAGTIRGNRYGHYTDKVWGTCRWVPTSLGAIPDTDEELLRTLRQIVLGARLAEAPAAVWELIPWSWLADWFSSIGDFLKTLQTDLPLKPEGVCIMRTMTAQSRYEITQVPSWPIFSMEGGYGEYRELKYRYIPAPIVGPSASVPSLNEGQWSILGSLAALKRS